MNVNQGGGYNLLLPLLKSSYASNAIFFLDTRVKSRVEELDCAAQILWVDPTIIARLKASWQVLKLSKSDDVALFFGNLPPLFKMPCRSYVFLQNRLLIDNQSLDNFGLKMRIRLRLERFILSLFRKNTDIFLVQTPCMERVLRRKFPLDFLRVAVFPYVEESFADIFPVKEQCERSYDFIYPASGDYHKNHAILLDAWRILAEQKIYPRLVLTLTSDHFNRLIGDSGTQELVDSGYIVNVGFVAKADLDFFYKNSNALIFPSLVESFGLPLIEARSYGLDIIAGETDYVRDIVDPHETFDASSSISIARAVKRYLNITDEKVQLSNADDFLEYISSK